MTVRAVCISGVVLACITVLIMFTIDGPIARAVQPHAAANARIVNVPVTALEILFGFPLSKFATGFALVLAALVLFAVARGRTTARLLLFVGLTHLVIRLVAGVSKNVFLRARPDEALLAGGWRDAFFVDGGSSFPSGHAAHFWALFFALAVAFPKLRIPALVLAVFVSAARVVVNDHYVSDVVASAAIAALLTCGMARLLLPRAPRPAA